MTEEKDDLSNYEWMIRPCEVYKDEYNECRGIKARFNQYFIHGEATDCSQWKRDYDNCSKWVEKKDSNAARLVIESENYRRQVRLKNHFKNDVWTRRRSPPEDWNKPLPEWMQKNLENTYLAQKSREMKGEIPQSVFENRTMCTIL